MGKFFIQNGMISRFDFMDNQEFLPLPTICNLLNQNDLNYERLKQKYLDLKERAVFPKFKPNSDLFVIVGYADETRTIEQYYIDEIVIRGDGSFIEYRDIDQETIIGEDNLLFATYEEAEKELNEIINVYKQKETIKGEEDG
jgi:hypothetical protein